MAVLQWMHVSPAEYSYVWLPRKWDFQTDRKTDRHRKTDAEQIDPYVRLWATKMYTNKKFGKLWYPARPQVLPWNRSKVKSWCQFKGLVIRNMHAKYQCSSINTSDDISQVVVYVRQTYEWILMFPAFAKAWGTIIEQIYYILSNEILSLSDVWFISRGHTRVAHVLHKSAFVLDRRCAPPQSLTYWCPVIPIQAA